MSGLNTVVGLFVLGASLAVVLYASGRTAPIIERVAGIISTEVASGGAGGSNGWGG